MDKNFWRYIKEKKSLSVTIIALALGLILIVMGSKGENSASVEVGIEAQLSEVCSGMDGVGECVVMVYYSPKNAREDPKIESVIVICDGADSSDVRLRLTEMLSSFFGIGANRIRIEKKG